MPESESPALPPEQEKQRTSDEVLRAKYLDYCSAQLAGILLLLSPDRIYQLAQKGASSEGLDVTSLAYDELVQVATREISRIIPLPPFRVWVDDYRRNPDVYEEHLLGLWEETPEEVGGLG